MSINAPFDELAQSIFNKTLQECSEVELQQLVKDYPYFGPAQLLLTKKLQEEDSSLLEDQVQTTSLYFPNRIWLQYLLNGNSLNNIAIHHPTTEKTETPIEITEAGLVNAAPVINENKEMAAVDQQLVAEGIKELPEVRDEMQQTSDVPAGEVIINENEETPAMPETVHEEGIEPANTFIEMRSLKIEPITDTGVIFEPFHTVDYFASQGIKFREDDKPKDHFSQQLKSFTEWLKTMKRIPATETNIATDVATEKKVEQLAEHSLAERHVVTEAMAEVWTKQGNRVKAEEIYRKLSLLDPSKSSYFAAKIEDLKKTS